jgi:hypothetical protein
MVDALYTALTDQALRQKCRTLAPSVAQRFSAQKMVEQTMRVYEQAAALHTATQGRTQGVSFVR